MACNSPFSTLVALAFAVLPIGALGVSDVIDAGHCTDCHGSEGVSVDPDVPTIAGQSAFVISDALIAFQEGSRPCRKGATADGSEIDHCELVADMDVDTFDAIGEHYAELEFVPADQDFDATLAAAGEAVHEDKCSKCHTEGGSVADDDAGILAGQWMGYLRNTFADYIVGDRAMPGKMQPKMEELSAEDVEALVHYYASQAGE